MDSHSHFPTNTFIKVTGVGSNFWDMKSKMEYRMDFLTLPGECGQRLPCPRHRQFWRTISKWKKQYLKKLKY